MYEELKKKRDEINTKAMAHSAALRKFPKGEMGLTADEVKSSPEYKEHRKGYDAAHSKLREINGFINKHYSKEQKAERAEARAKEHQQSHWKEK
jgi:hypothetical protein